MSSIILYQPEYDLHEAIDHFMDEYHSANMRYLASDFLSEGFSPQEIILAVRKAVTICQTAGLESRRHFYPVYTQYKGSTVKDCKLSAMAYKLVLLNGPEHRRLVAEFQFKLLQDVEV